MALYPPTQFDFPNVSNYDSDLREVLRIIQTLLNDYNEIVESVKEVTDGYDKIVKDFEALKELVEDFETQIDDAVKDSVEEYTEKFNVELLKLYELINTINADVAAILEQAKLYTDYKTTQNFAHFTVAINDINRRIDELQWTLPDVYNLTRGTTTDLVTLIYDVYDATRDKAYTALDFDTANRTAAELDALNENAYNLDVNGYVILYPTDMVINPYTGLHDNINDVLSMLAQAAANNEAISASDYDALELTATEYENYSVTAVIYDLYASTVLI